MRDFRNVCIGDLREGRDVSKSSGGELCKRGSVALVGAGPGDAGLLTLRGCELLENAEVVVYDRLVGEGVLRHAPRGAEMIDVGKSGGSHPVPQVEIERILAEKAGEGKKVVRLKGGDPFLFGRGGEELAALMALGISCEVVPGVTSAFAVPAYAGIPATHRGLASSVHVVAAHRMAENPSLDFETLARLEGTLVFLMGVSGLNEIASGLIRAGMDGEMPAALLERGTTARQRVLKTSLSRLPEEAGRGGFAPPAVLVVGSVVSLADDLDWRGLLPLSGKRILVTRPEHRKPRLGRMLRDRGAEVVQLPCIGTEILDGMLPSFEDYEWAVFTSPTGVEAFFERLRREKRDVRSLGATKMAAVGPSTLKALEMRGLMVELMPERYDGAALGGLLAGRACGRVLLLRAERGAPELLDILREAGVEYDEFPLYRTLRTEGLEKIDMREIDAAAFASASSVRSFAASYPKADIKAVCIGERTAEAAREAGLATYVAEKATLSDLVNKVEEAVSEC